MVIKKYIFLNFSKIGNRSIKNIIRNKFKSKILTIDRYFKGKNKHKKS